MIQKYDVSKNLLLSSSMLFLTIASFAQIDSAKLILSGYAEMYYTIDRSRPSNHEKAYYLYNYKRVNEFALNLAMINASYETSQTRSNLGFMVGNYTTYNLGNEPQWARVIYQANIGYKPFKKYNAWIDVGILPSHIGFESIIGSECLALTRSIAAENSPYYESGLRLSSKTNNGLWYVSFLVLNGWQRIQQWDGFSRKGLGSQVTFTPSDKWTINYSNFYGTVYPDASEVDRWYHNFYINGQMSEKFGLTMGFDLGLEGSKNDQKYVWYTPQVMLKYQANKQHRFVLRYEYLYDNANVILIDADFPNNANKMSIPSFNWDIKLNDQLMFRSEYRFFSETRHSNSSRQMTFAATYKI